MNILQLLRDTNLGEDSYNIVGVTWFGMTFFFIYVFYIRCSHHKDRLPKGVLFGFASALLLHLLTDEINLWMFVLTRANVFNAIRQYFTIPDKIPRLILILLNLGILRSNYGFFKDHLNWRGLVIIIGATTLYAVASISMGMYGWEIIDPNNLGKYFYTYILYYLVLFVMIFYYYPNWVLLESQEYGKK